MELMATSLDKFYKFVYCTLDDVIPEEILGKITLAVSPPPFYTFLLKESVTKPVCFLQTVKALNHLKENLKIIHRGKKFSYTSDTTLQLFEANFSFYALLF